MLPVFKAQLHNSHIFDQSQSASLVVGSNSVNFYKPGYMFLWVFFDVLGPSCFYTPSSLSSKAFLTPSLLFGCESLYLSPSVNGWLFDNSWSSYQFDHRTWSIQAIYPLLLAVLVGIILVDSWGFPLIRFLPDLPKPPFPVFSFGTLNFHLFPKPIPQVPTPRNPSSPRHLFFPPSQGYVCVSPWVLLVT